MIEGKQAEQAWHSYETSKNKIDRYGTTKRARSNELLQLTLEGYRMGEVSDCRICKLSSSL